MNTIILIFVLLLIFQFKHFIVDYVVQSYRKDGMDKFNEIGWFVPLLKHASDHGFFTIVISVLVLQLSGVLSFKGLGLILILFWFDTIIHFTMDRIKASPHMLGRFTIEDRRFWMALGFDQAVHHLTHYTIIFVLVWFIKFSGV